MGANELGNDDWWWSKLLPGEKVDPLRLESAALPYELYANAVVGQRMPNPCLNYKAGWRAFPNDGFRRIASPDELREGRTAAAAVTSGGHSPLLTLPCTRGALHHAEWYALQQGLLVLDNERNELREQARAMAPLLGAGHKPAAALEFHHPPQCRDKGLVHKLNNLEAEIQIAIYANRTLETIPLIEPYGHTGCRVSYDVPWEYVVDWSGLPVRYIDRKAIGEARVAKASGGTSVQRFLSFDPASMESLRAVPPEVRITLAVTFPGDPPRIDFPWCTQYFRQVTWTPLFLPWSAPVKAAAREVAEQLTRRAPSGGGGPAGYDAVHFRMGDKAGNGDPFIALRAMASDELFARVYAHVGRLGPGPDGDARRPLYVATDSPRVLLAGRGAVALRHFWPLLRSTGDSHRTLARHCSEPQLLSRARNCSGEPFYVMAVEMALLEGAARFVASERSNPSRRVVLKRNVDTYAASSPGAPAEAAAAGAAAAGAAVGRGVGLGAFVDIPDDAPTEPVRYLYSSLVLRLASASVNMAEWERATIRGDEGAVASLDAAATVEAKRLFQEAMALLETTPCLRARGMALSPAMPTVGFGVARHEGVTLAECCRRCGLHASEARAGSGTGGCTAWQWESNHTVGHHQEVAGEGAHARRSGGAPSIRAKSGSPTRCWRTAATPRQ